MAYQRQFAEFNPQTGDPIGLHPESDPRSAEIKKMPYYGIWLCSLNHDHRVRIIGKEFWHPNRKIVNRITPEYSLHFVLNGAGFMNGIPIRRGDAFLTEPVRSHSIISDPKNPLTLYWMIFDRWCSPDVSEMQRLVFAESPIRHMSHPQRQLIFSVFEMLFDETANPENESRTGFLANAIVSVLSTSEDCTRINGYGSNAPDAIRIFSTIHPTSTPTNAKMNAQLPANPAMASAARCPTVYFFFASRSVLTETLLFARSDRISSSLMSCRISRRISSISFFLSVIVSLLL